MNTRNRFTILAAAMVSLTVSACSSQPKQAYTLPQQPIAAAAIAAAAIADVPQIKETERGPSLTLDNVLFDFDQTNLRSEAQPAIDLAASYLLEDPERNANIEGHTDSTGDSQYNHDLSLRRSSSVKAALLEAGVPEQRIEMAAFGEEQPIADNNDPLGRKANRRVEILFPDSGL